MRKIESIIFYFFLVVIPLQTRLILDSGGSRFFEWRAMVLYGTDVLIFILFAFWAYDFFSSKTVGVRLASFRPSKPGMLLLGLAIAATVSVFVSSAFTLSIYALLRLMQLLLFFQYVRNYAIHKFSVTYALYAFIAGGLFQALLGITQYAIQSNVGLPMIGETLLSPEMNGVAVFYNVFGVKVLRAYGTFPHPNVLAAYLAVASVALFSLAVRLWHELRFRRLLVMAQVVLSVGLLVTFSRTAIAFWALGIMILAFSPFFIRRMLVHKKVILVLCAAALISSGLLAVVLWGDTLARIMISSSEEAVTYRVFLNHEATRTGSGVINWFGVGIGNFVNWFMENRPNIHPSLYQPIHNVYLLAYAETGLFGVGFFLLFLGMITYRAVRKGVLELERVLVLCAAGMLFAIGLFDHFPWTLQQGKILFWGVMGLLASRA